ncbi:unnamed protein product [Paramecium sonneborni]|uniref:Uncharacterized protein n=1 Tax=Paramecium sonneborni TaxID=65129 RepID=A0A8S1KBT0_9CILI|nr:unnamed protein product [Paramecium sonneborni]
MIYVLEDNILGTILLFQIINTWKEERKKNKKIQNNSEQSTCEEIKYDQI